MPIRRATDPISVQHVWDAIRCAIVQRQMADTKRLVKYLVRVDKCTDADAELHIQQSLKDGLIVALQKVTRTSNGDVVESYRISSQELPTLDGKDWYCFECHLAGDVVACSKCFRVFHPNCTSNGRRKFDEFQKTNTTDQILSVIPNNPATVTTSTSTSINNEKEKAVNISETDELGKIESTKLLLNNNDSNSSGQSKELTTTTINNQTETDAAEVYYDETLCSMCNIAKADKGVIEKSELNYLLKFVIHRIQSWLPNTITDTMAEEERPEWLTEKELTWRSNQLFFEHKDMSVIEVNLNNESYTTVHEFLADVLTIQHNVAIFHGIQSQEFGAAELMVRDCIHDLTELKLCVDCYRHSNEKINSKWFCLPCRVPHKLVWAKQKGYPYWPAKVLRETSIHYDVRFFGGKYERSLLQKSYIKPIETPQNKLQIKQSSAFNKSVDELKFHQKLLKNPEELQKLIESSKQRSKAIAAKQKLSPLMKSPKSLVSNSEISLEKRDGFGGDVYDFEDDPFANQSLSFAQNRRKKRPSSNSQGSSSKKKKVLDEKNDKGKSEGVIHISDGEEEDQFSFREDYSGADFGFNNGSYEQVTSSTETYKNTENFSNTRGQENGMQQLDHPYSDSVEKMRRRLEGLSDRKDLIKCAMDCMQSEIDKISNDHNDHLKRLFESHNAQISETKKKQWCYNCEQEAIYHCCWNTAYCSQTCQQQHWQAEHKKVCRRKR